MLKIELSDEEVKVVRTALQSYLLDITREEFPLHRTIRGVLDKLPRDETAERLIRRNLAQRRAG